MGDMSPYLDLIAEKLILLYTLQIRHAVTRKHFRLVRLGFIPDVRMS